MENKIKVVEKVLRYSDQKQHHLHLNFSTWLKTELADIKKCANVFSCKFGKNRRNSVEFRYDPLSYALNFEDDNSPIDEYLLRNFSARLPQSPPPSEKKNGVKVIVSRDIAAWS